MTDISMIAQLREFGFTESEAKVYVALLEGGAVSGYEASKLSGVARSKIYTILEALIQRGAVLSSSDGARRSTARNHRRIWRSCCAARWIGGCATSHSPPRGSSAARMTSGSGTSAAGRARAAAACG